MKTVYIFEPSACGNESAEPLESAKGMFSEDGELLSCWGYDDECIWGEPFDTVLLKLGYSVYELPEEYHERAIRDMRATLGVA